MKNKFIDAFNATINEVLQTLDISPSTYKLAVERYEAIGKWLNDETSTVKIDVYPQGSFQLGTVTKPDGDSEEVEYDIDLVAELAVPKERTSPEEIKKAIGDRLRAHARYKEMLDDEGKRCWTIEYAEQGGVAFHIDVLPAVAQDLPKQLELDQHGVPDELARTAIAITNREDSGSYSWAASNPRGYAKWFRDINQPYFEKFAQAEKTRIVKTASEVYASIQDVPDLLVRTPLQKAVQLLKRHRDVRFAGHALEKAAPISMIITTLAARLYQGEADVYGALSAIVQEFTSFTPLMAGTARRNGRTELLRRTLDGKWRIENPVDPEENFADRWHKDEHRCARAFFQWVEWLKEDFFSDEDTVRLEKTASMLTGRISGAGKFASVNIHRKEAPHVEIKNPPRAHGSNQKRVV
jgi:hypothetical protein